jgi:hypothetical protein
VEQRPVGGDYGEGAGIFCGKGEGMKQERGRQAHRKTVL